jgi:hypothetical protein
MRRKCEVAPIALKGVRLFRRRGLAKEKESEVELLSY